MESKNSLLPIKAETQIFKDFECSKKVFFYLSYLIQVVNQPYIYSAKKKETDSKKVKREVR